MKLSELDPIKTETQIHFLCPCGCGGRYGIKLAGPGAWEISGEYPETISAKPSIMLDSGHWHGYLTNGEFKSV